MKTAFGYFFLCLASAMIGVVLVVLYFALAGKLPTLEVMLDNQLYHRGTIIYGVIHLLLIFPLTYFGLKWIRKAEKTSPL